MNSESILIFAGILNAGKKERVYPRRDFLKFTGSSP
jgi:hypothetical protein